MLISYHDSRRYPSESLALESWVRIAELAARQVVCPPQGFDPLQFARALELCRRLTCRSGPEALQRMIVTCAAAGVAVVVVPNFDRCRASSASKWLVCSERRKQAMIALSIRYRRDDQLFYSLFREAGAILAAEKRVDPQITTDVHRLGNSGNGICVNRCESVDRSLPEFSKRSLPDAFARQFIIPPECDSELSALTAADDLERAVAQFARTLGVAPGLVVGRMQHDGLISWKQLNHLKREVDLAWVLRSAQAIEQTWPDQQMATRAVMKDLCLEEAPARARLRRAVAAGTLPTNRKQRREMRFDPAALAVWRLLARDRDLDAEDRYGGEGRDAA